MAVRLVDLHVLLSACRRSRFRSRLRRHGTQVAAVAALQAINVHHHHVSAAAPSQQGAHDLQVPVRSRQVERRLPAHVAQVERHLLGAGAYVAQEHLHGVRQAGARGDVERCAPVRIDAVEVGDARQGIGQGCGVVYYCKESSHVGVGFRTFDGVMPLHLRQLRCRGRQDASWEVVGAGRAGGVAVGAEGLVRRRRLVPGPGHLAPAGGASAGRAGHSRQSLATAGVEDVQFHGGRRHRQTPKTGHGRWRRRHRPRQFESV
mmetsp:Transcript_23315/g.59759  ORF Transcript_23315/g.59759 Transcript_23315/m.59759 type:complete len:261 (+) Transcript_23315:878-1660(+)